MKPYKDPHCLLFLFDEPGAAAKLLKTYAKNFEALEIKALSVEGQLLGAEQIDVLAKLPGREEAITLIAAVLQALSQSLRHFLTRFQANWRECFKQFMTKNRRQPK